MAEGLDPERVRWALTHPAYGPWLRALFHDVSGYNATGADEYLWKEEDEPRIRELVDAFPRVQLVAGASLMPDPDLAALPSVTAATTATTRQALPLLRE